MNRETWLNQVAELMAPRFAEMGYPVPKFRVAVGWTSHGESEKVAGQCWHSSRSADKVFEILIAPILDDSMTVAATLAHELAHAAVGFEHGHKGAFAKVVLALGLQRPLTVTTPGPAFKEWAQPFIDQLGALPHARIMLKGGVPQGGEGEAEGEGEPEGRGNSNEKKKQSTRMLKAECQAMEKGEGETETKCGYTVRLTKKWALKLGACCPVHGAMEVEGADSMAESDEDAA